MSCGPRGWARVMAARWSSENVVVEFRDSQVSWGPVGPSEHAPFLVPLPHAAGSVAGASGRPPALLVR